MFSNQLSTLAHASASEDHHTVHLFKDLQYSHFACVYSIKAFFSFITILFDVTAYTILPGNLDQAHYSIPRVLGFAMDASERKTQNPLVHRKNPFKFVI